MRAVALAGTGLFGMALGGFAWRYAVVWGQPAPEGTPVGPAVLINVALFAAFALHHSVLARASAKRLISRLIPPALERSAYVSVASLLFITTWLLWQPLPGVAWQAPGLVRPLYIGIQTVGVLLAVRSAARLDIRDFVGLRRAEQAPPLEVDGPYRWMRHPLYLGWILLVFGTPTMTMTRLVWALVSSAYVVMAIPLEERSLAATFGAPYRAYQQRVRWRLVPGVW